MKYLYKLLIMLFIISLFDMKINGQIINNNSTIKIFSEAFVTGINTDFINNGDGLVENDGTITLNGGNWINNSNNNVFSNYHQKGVVKLIGGNEQLIKGSNRTIFETLQLSNGSKILEITDTEVRDKLILNNLALLKLNLNKIIVDNKQPEGVSSDSSSYILSENIGYDYDSQANGDHNDVVYGELQWNIGDNTGTYFVPFGTAEGNKLTLRLKLYSPGQPASGNMVFATYPTNSLNYPLPTAVKSLEELHADDVVDRYWKIHSNYDSKPSADIKFKFTDNDISQTSNPGLSADKLLAIRYNSNSNTWLDWTANGSSSSAYKTVAITAVNSNDLFDWWTLTAKSKLETTDFFTPNGDGHNDVFIPEFSVGQDGKIDPNTNTVQGIIRLEGKIFNRWGNLIYEWTGDNWWDGKYKGTDVAEGTYFYTITAKGSDGVDYNKKGTVALLRK